MNTEIYEEALILLAFLAAGELALIAFLAHLLRRAQAGWERSIERLTILAKSSTIGEGAAAIERLEDRARAGREALLRQQDEAEGRARESKTGYARAVKGIFSRPPTVKPGKTEG